MSNGNKFSKTIVSIAETVSTSPEALVSEIDEFKKNRCGKSRLQLAHSWSDKIVRFFASEGAATALPGAIPGLGTVTQIAVEGGAISADVLYMIRCMARIVGGVGAIYEHDLRKGFTQDFVKVLALWCGVLVPAKEAGKRIGTKVAVAQFKRVPGEIFKRVNRKVGTTIVTKYGTKRGGIAIGRLIPFGVGALVGGGFNYVTMKGFKKHAITYYTEDLDLRMKK